LRIKAVIFDACGILYRRKKKDSEFHLVSLRRLGWQGSEKQIMNVWSTLKQMVFKGSLQRKRAIKLLLSECGIEDQAIVQKYFEKYDAWKEADIVLQNEVKRTLSRLKRNNIKIAILTDSAYSATEKRNWFARLGILEFVDTILSSYDTGVTKDSPKAFGKVLEELDLKVDQAIFVGHEPHELAGAQSAGIATVCLKPESKADYVIQGISQLVNLVKID